MSGYKTEQKKALLDYLRAHREESFCIEGLARRMAEDTTLQTIPGKSTLYRLMTALVEDGTVKRFVNGNSRQFLYQLTGGDHCDSHLHLKCTQCGKLFHMDNAESERILHTVLQENAFTIDETQTVFFGCCSGCRK